MFLWKYSDFADTQANYVIWILLVVQDGGEASHKLPWGK
jgi:hypothetical protein